MRSLDVFPGPSPDRLIDGTLTDTVDLSEPLARNTHLRKWLVKVGLDYPTSPSAIRRILAGEDVPWPERKPRRAEPGDVVADLPPTSIPGLLEGGRIEEVTDGD